MKIGVDKVMNEVIVQNADFDVDIGATEIVLPFLNWIVDDQRSE